MKTITTMINLGYEVCIQIARLFHPKRRDALYIVLLGGPGAGKGTIAGKLAPRLGIPHLNIGSLIRREIELQTAFGLQFAQDVKDGRLVPDGAVLRLVFKELKKEDYCQGAVVDGIRTLNQGKKLRHQLARWGNRVDVAVHLEVSKEDMLERLALRRTCSNKSCEKSYHLKFQPPQKEGLCDACGSALYEREDQKEAALITRMEEFNRTFFPLKLFYENQGVMRTVVSTNQTGPEHVYEEVLFAIDEVD